MECYDLELERNSLLFSPLSLHNMSNAGEVKPHWRFSASGFLQTRVWVSSTHSPVLLILQFPYNFQNHGSCLNLCACVCVHADLWCTVYPILSLSTPSVPSMFSWFPSTLSRLKSRINKWTKNILLLKAVFIVRLSLLCALYMYWQTPHPPTNSLLAVTTESLLRLWLDIFIFAHTDIFARFCYKHFQDCHRMRSGLWLCHILTAPCYFFNIYIF